MPVKRTDSSKKLFAKIERQAKLTMHLILDGAGARSDEKTPVAWSNLVNSRYKTVTYSAGNITGELGYLADYAKYLNGTKDYTPLWKPRPLPKYEIKGIGTITQRKNGTVPEARAGAPATNMSATPRFLDWHGFESPEAKAEIENDIKTGMKL